MTEPTQPTRERVTVKLRDEQQKAPEPKPDKKPKESTNA